MARNQRINFTRLLYSPAHQLLQKLVALGPRRALLRIQAAIERGNRLVYRLLGLALARDAAQAPVASGRLDR